MNPPLPHALELVPRWRRRRAAAGHLLVALDFDGTLAPIVPRPEQARPSPGILDALAALSGRGDTDIALVSGRGLADLRSRLDLPGVYYAGNHGLEIEGPGVHQVHADARAALPLIQATAAALHRPLAGLDGVHLENKGLTLSIHFRQAADPDATQAAIDRLLHDTCAGDQRLRFTRGKRVVEIRPRVDWDKGRATRFLIQAIEGPRGEVPALFIGDDLTDEDAFRELASLEGGVLVAAEPRSTAASAWLRDIPEVRAFLEALAE